MANVFRPPIIGRIFAKLSIPADNPVNLRTLFSPNPSRPFVQSDWQLPAKALKPLKSDADANLRNLLTPNPSRPFRLDEWPRPSPALQPLKSDAPANVRNLISPNPARPFNQYDWEPVNRPIISLKSDAPANVRNLIAPNPSRPFNQYDWEPVNPPLQAAKPEASVNIQYIFPVVAAQPFIVSDWPKAYRATYLPATFDPPNLAGTLAAPFTNYDWSGPTAQARNKPDDNPPNLLVSTLLVVAQASPFSQTDWPLAARHDGTIPPTDFQSMPGLFPPGPTPVVVPESTQGMGPGWNLFHPPVKRRPNDRSREDIEAELIAALENATDAGTHKERKEAVRELKAVARGVVAEAPPDLAKMAGELQSLMRLQMGADRLLAGFADIIARQTQQDNDDEEALIFIALGTA